MAGTSMMAKTMEKIKSILDNYGSPLAAERVFLVWNNQAPSDNSMYDRLASNGPEVYIGLPSGNLPWSLVGIHTIDILVVFAKNKNADFNGINEVDLVDGIRNALMDTDGTKYVAGAAAPDSLDLGWSYDVEGIQGLLHANLSYKFYDPPIDEEPKLNEDLVVYSRVPATPGTLTLPTSGGTKKCPPPLFVE